MAFKDWQMQIFKQEGEQAPVSLLRNIDSFDVTADHLIYSQRQHQSSDLFMTVSR